MDVCLVVVPFIAVQRPSISLGILNAGLNEAKIDSTVVYSNIEFAELIGIENYWFIGAHCHLDLLGEWVFSKLAFPEHKINDSEYFAEAGKYLKNVIPDKALLNFYFKGKSLKRYFEDIRQQAGEFIEDTARKIIAMNPKIVGCSSTMQQHCPSLALLRRIHELNPDIITIMGGANCEDSLGYITHKNFTWVDYVVSGEADILFPDLCRAIMEKGRNIEVESLPQGVLGPMSRKYASQKPAVYRATVEDLDKSPIPDFDDYIKALNSSAIKEYILPALLIESSRGCWWRQKNQCTFCGLNSDNSFYRTKSPRRVIDELEGLAEKYGINKFMVADSILSMQYFDTVLPDLGKPGRNRHSILYEVKANLKREQVRLLKAAGIDCIQPGIESLHNSILELLHKGNKLWDNIELLKWAREFSINTVWLMLSRIPEEKDVWYEEMAGILPLIVHLQPPSVLNNIYYSRLSRYHKNPSDYNLKLVPLKTYSYIYPLSEEDINQFALYFDDEAMEENEPGERPGLKLMSERLSEWIELWSSFMTKQADSLVSLKAEEISGGIRITDTRPCAVESVINLKGIQASAYKICEVSSKPSRILKELKEAGYEDLQRDSLELILDELIKKKILLKIEDRYLSLAVYDSEYPFDPIFPGGEVVWEKILKAFSQSKVEAVSVSPFAFDMTLEDLFFKNG